MGFPKEQRKLQLILVVPHVTNELLDALLILSVDAGLELLLVGVRGIA